MRFQGKVALVTGSGRGLGEEVVTEFAHEGADVIVNDIDSNNAQRVARSIKSLGKKSLAIQADVSNASDVERMFEVIHKEFGGLDILVNNAGVIGNGLVEDISEKDWRRVVDVNLTGVFLCCKSAIPLIKPRGKGKIVNVTSFSARRVSLFAGAHYTASKAAVTALTRQLAVELGPLRINVNAVCPGMISPQTGQPLAQFDEISEYRRRAMDLIPLGQKFGNAKEIAEAILFLASDAASYITGEEIAVDGGMLCTWFLDPLTYRKGRTKH